MKSTIPITEKGGTPIMKTYRSSAALGEFIRSRRQRLKPEDCGIDPLPGRRRTPGLRREEVAYLANMSVTYYTWLEQGKDLNPSPDILLGIGRALQLGDSERSYMLSLAETDLADEPLSAAPIDLPLLRTLAGQMRYPSFITDDDTNVLAWNRAAELTLADFGRMPERDRHMMQLAFLDADYRQRLVNWEEFGRYTAAWLRTLFERAKHSPVYMERFEQLNRESEHFRRCWDLYEIKQNHAFAAELRLPNGTEMHFDIRSAGCVDHNPALIWTILVPQAGSGTEERLTRLLAEEAAGEREG